MRGLMGVLLVLLFAGGIRANDTMLAGQGGRVAPVQGEKTSVRMLREWVKMDVYPTYYDVAAQFVFRNDGPATSVTMGFPETGSGGIDSDMYRNRTAFLSFCTTVDGSTAAARRQDARVSNDNEPNGYRTYWVKTVAFAAGQQHTVRVEYRARPGEDTAGRRWAWYPFTGGNWKGTVEESTLAIRLHLPGDYLVNPNDGLTLRGDTLSGRWTNWEAEGAYGIDYTPTLPDGLPLYQGVGDGVLFGAMPVHLPGKTPSPCALPPALLRNGTPCIGLDALLNYFEEETGEPDARRRGKRWDAKTHTITISHFQFSAQVKAGDRIMRASSIEVRLPVAPFYATVTQGFNGKASCLYIPVYPLAKALGGDAEYDPTQRTVVLHFAEDPVTGPHAPFTYYAGWQWVTEARRQLMRAEMRAIAEGHEPWRQDPLSVASVETADLLPAAARPAGGGVPKYTEEQVQQEGKSRKALTAETPAGKISYILVSEESRITKVDLVLPDDRTIHLTLERPFEGWWYVTKIEKEE